MLAPNKYRIKEWTNSKGERCFCMQRRFLRFFWLTLTYRLEPVKCPCYDRPNVRLSSDRWSVSYITDMRSAEVVRKQHEKVMWAQAATIMHNRRVKQKIAASKTKYHTYP